MGTHQRLAAEHKHSPMMAATTALVEAFTAFLLLANGGLSAGAAADFHKVDGERSSVPWFRNFNGVVSLPPPEMSKQLGIGWARVPFYWDLIEPQRGQWNWSATDRTVLGAITEDVKVLPMLGYTAPWAKAPGVNDRGPVRDIADWEAFVQQVVARYSQPPYSLRYFQLWNEPTKQAGFWSGQTNRDFIDLIYLPAARIVRRYACYVVFGGWPISNSLEEYDQILAYRDAWKWTDILDVHYTDVPAWQHLFDRWIKTGKCRGVWQTEVGFTNDPFFLPRLYLDSLHFALGSGWNDSDQYKLFWYAEWGAGPDADKCLTKTASGEKLVLTSLGRRLATLNDLLGRGPLKDFPDFTLSLSGGAANFSAKGLGFCVGDTRRVIALILDGLDAEHPATILLKLKLGVKPDHAELVSPLGQRRPIGVAYREGAAQVLIQTGDAPADEKTSSRQVLYLEFDED